MKVSKQLVNYAKLIVSNDHKDEIIDLITLKLMHRFKRASDEQRAVIADTLNSLDLFFTELDSIIAESKPVNTVENREEETNG